jgi:hypothetical protein
MPSLHKEMSRERRRRVPKECSTMGVGGRGIGTKESIRGVGWSEGTEASEVIEHEIGTVNVDGGQTKLAQHRRMRDRRRERE